MRGRFRFLLRALWFPLPSGCTLAGLRHRHLLTSYKLDPARVSQILLTGESLGCKHRDIDPTKKDGRRKKVGRKNAKYFLTLSPPPIVPFSCLLSGLEQQWFHGHVVLCPFIPAAAAAVAVSLYRTLAAAQQGNGFMGDSRLQQACRHLALQHPRPDSFSLTISFSHFHLLFATVKI